ncbi:MAG: tetratricopeptide repeat protein [Pseudomonadota bacterium]|nr:tetratricopeptide repeat protein [Pseudomonadota bacterium]
MTGLLILALIVVATLAALWLLKLRGPKMTLSAAALMLGSVGYVLQGRPSLDGSPNLATVRPAPIPLVGARKALMGQFSAADTWITISEGYASRGQTQDAVGVMNSAIRARPTDYAMWVGLGNALADHGRTQTPAARFAFGRAAELAPGHPAPRFFLGLSLARSGEPRQALALWREILAETPAEASWRPFVEDAAMALESDLSRTR